MSARKSAIASRKKSGLPGLRSQIDAIDSQLIELLNKRADLVHEIGVIKRKDNSPIYVPEREEQLLRSLIRRSTGRLTPASIRAIYREIMSASLALEKDLSIAYLGPEGTWSHQAARGKFGASVRYLPQSTIRDVFKIVEHSRADYGVVPIENSTEGAVSHTLDVFTDSPLHICAQVLLKIEHNLVAKIPRAKIARLYSHPQVFGQCRNWLHEHMPEVELVEVGSTSAAAELATRSKDAGAITARAAAELHGLEILETGIQDIANNTTRFLVIGESTSKPTGRDKTSIMFAIQDKAGALFSALRPFQQLKLNMSKIESRPSKRKAWEYFFFVDVLGHCEDEPVARALAELEKHCSFVKILGSYPNSESQ